MVMRMRSILRNSSRTFLALGLSLGLASCDQEETGTVSVRVWGEGYIEDGVPAADVQDGWSVDFTTFNTEIKDVDIAGERVVLVQPQINATQKSVSDAPGERGQEIGSVQVGPGTHTHASFVLVKTLVEGVARKADKTVSFKWEFNTPVRYSQCGASTRVKADTNSQFEITLHADHYLYDSLAAHNDPKLVFDPIAAADLNNDGTITQQELEQTPIADTFDTGSQKVTNMWAWLVAQNLTVAHTDGEHHCKGEVL